MKEIYGKNYLKVYSLKKHIQEFPGKVSSQTILGKKGLEKTP